ncbi:hypothetical protein [Rhizobium tumorigenes]|uniref:Uncharacterized protein n=1 Tax=Rhizobium tumorigenes TaxID=2041385 RepID=A0AAF1K2E1_9HYPH|nr:hypothetical protein [Rhizobium tumorigenes]WFR94084.1 hypothetical protein PR017_09495 [Rhizobium tumorigenes]
MSGIVTIRLCDVNQRLKPKACHGGGRWMSAGQKDEDKAPVTRMERLRLWLAGYSALEVIARRENDHLFRDAGMSRDEVRDSLRPWRIVGLLLLPRSGRE